MFWVNVIASNLGSFALGVLVCKYVGRRAAAAVDHITDHSEVPMQPRRTALMPLPARVIVLVLIGSLMFGLGVRVGYQLLADKVSCFNEYASQNADSQSARSKATEELQHADQRFKRAVVNALTPGATRADFEAVRETAEEAVAKQRQLEADRHRHPYPEAPREVCQ